MRFYALATLAPAVFASKAGDWCSAPAQNDIVSDPTRCEQEIFAADPGCGHGDEDCYKAVVAEYTGANEDDTASDEFATNEFLSSINEDPLIQEVVETLNRNKQVLEATGFVAGDETTGQAARLDAEKAAAAQAQIAENKGQLNSLGQKTLGNGTISDFTVQQGIALNDEQGQLKRFVELKQLVSWMQPKDKRISRYCFYGCWCLPEGAHSFIAGEGHPVDLVDRACQLFWFCYQCAKQEFAIDLLGKERVCHPEKTKYTFRFKYNKRKPNDYKARDIVCKDNWYNPMNTRDKWKSNCAKAFCECDRGIAMRLYKSWKHWDKSRHRIWSQRVETCPRMDACAAMPTGTRKKNYEREQCMRVGCLFKVDERCLYGAGGNNEEDSQPVCCGIYEDDGARWEMRDHGGRYACCNHDVDAGFGDKLPWNGAWYNTITHCCKDGAVESSGNC